MLARRTEKTEAPSQSKGLASGSQRHHGEPAPQLAPAEPRGLDAPTLLHLQRTVGNQAVAQLVALRRAGPAADPKFQALTREVRAKQGRVGAHPPGRAAAAAAQGAAHAPPDDREAQAKTAQAGEMAAARPGEFDKAAFIRAVNEAIAAQAPRNLDEADGYASSGKAEQVKGQVQGEVGEGKKASAAQIETATRASPDTSVAVDKKVTPLAPDRPPGTPAAPNPSQAVPDRAPASATDLSAGPRQVNEEMAEAQVTDQQLARSNEPEFEGALKEKKEAEQHSATSPAQVRGAEARTLASTRAAAAATGAAAMAGMAAHRAQVGARVTSGQHDTRGSDETRRAQVTARLQRVFDATRRDVEGILSGLDRKVDEQFSAEEGRARQAFTADMNRRMDEYKSRRYGGFTGKLRWVKDKFMGLPAEANEIFATARAGYVSAMQGVISRVADTIAAELGRAKQRIVQGRAELQAEVRKLPADLQALGREAATGFESQFEELTATVAAKAQELVQTLASRYTEALKAVDAQIEEEKARNQGLVARAVGAIKGVIDTILKLKDLLLGVLARAAQAVMAILKDPIGFLGHLVSAVGAGLRGFISRIGEHLKKGLVSWLLGAAAQAGIQLPDKFDLKGIIQLVAGLLGLTWSAIRARVVSRGVPDQVITAAETAVPEAQLLAREGLPGLWQQITSRLGDLKAMILGKLSEFLIPTVLIAGITWIISLLNPASAFVKAMKAIIDIVTFIFQRGAQILEFVNSVLDAIIAIAAGGAGGVPALVENALARSIPVLIGFLAALLGVGGLAEKVKSVFQAIARPVMKVVDWVVDKIVGAAKKLWAKLKDRFGGDRQGKPPGTAAEKQAAVDGAIGDVDRLMSVPGVTRTRIENALPRIRARRHLTELRLVDTGPDTYHAHASLNPERDSKDHTGPEEVEVTRQDLSVTSPQMSSSSWDVSLKARVPGGDVTWGLASAPIDANRQPTGGPSMYIDKNDLTIGDRKIRLKTAFSITEAALDLVNQAYRATFGSDPSVLTGSLAMANLRNFQREWYRASQAQPDAGPEAWAQSAIRSISFGRARVAAGYGTFTVILGPVGTIDLGAPHGPQAVPRTVDVTARKS